MLHQSDGNNDPRGNAFRFYSSFLNPPILFSAFVDLVFSGSTHGIIMFIRLIFVILSDIFISLFKYHNI